MSVAAHAGQVSLAWSPSPSSDVAGYRVYYGSASGVYTSNVDAGKATGVTVANLKDGATYYFAALAYDATGNKSGYSNEVSTTLSSAASAAFSVSATTVNASAAVTLAPSYTGSVPSWKWDFGDGSTPLSGTGSAVPQASKSYSKAGSYTVTLTVGSLAQSTVVNVLPVAAFAASSVSGTAPFAVNFTDSSAGSPSSWSWTFGDGTTSSATNPSHTFSAAGTYTVSLKVAGAGLTSASAATKTITVAAPVVSAPPPATATPVAANGDLMAAYSFEETSGTLVGDVSGNGNTGTQFSYPAWSAGKFGRGMEFSGGSQYVAVPNSPFLDIGGKGLTISLFAKLTDCGKDQVLLGKPANSSFAYPWYQYGVEFVASSKKLSLQLADTAGAAHSYDMAIPLGVWTHVAFTYDGASVKGYVDGVLKLNTAASFSIANAATPLRIGQDPKGSQSTKGSLDEIRIYNKAQSSTAIAADITKPATAASPLMVAYSFDGAAGTKAADASGKENTGTLVNSPSWTDGKFGSALRFGANKSVTVPNSSSVNIGGNGLTLSFYANITDNGRDQALFGKPVNSAFSYPWYQYGVEYTTSAKAFSLYLADTAGASHRYDMAAPQGVWSHIAFTYDGTNVKGYVNGVLKLTAAAKFKIPTASTALRIGTDPLGNQPANGALDELRIYNVAQPAAAIQANLKQAVVTTSPPQFLASQWRVGTALYPLPMGVAHASNATAWDTGMLTTVPVYIDAASSSSKVIVGVYSDKAGHPGTLLAQGTVANSQPGRWNLVPVDGVALTKGTRYWVAVLSPRVASAPVVYLRDVGAAGSGAIIEKSGQSSLTALPSTWTVGNQTNDGPLSAFAAGY